MTDANAPKGVSYWDYLRIDELLALQDGVERDESKLADHEVLFIVVHQVFELWFKLVLREVTTIRNALDHEPVPESSVPAAAASLRRVQVILEQMATHWRLMETLSTRDFLDFRDKLIPASGFQSGQFRELELLLGISPEERVNKGGDQAWRRALENADGTPSGSMRRLQARQASGPSVRELLDRWLWRTPIRGSQPDGPDDARDAAVVSGFVDEYLAAHAAEIGDPGQRAARQTSDPAAIARIAGQYRAEMNAARAFLRAEGDDVPAADRARRARIRAAIVFIESYRELPLLAWPRDMLDALVSMEQSMLVFRQRHARMVERIIGRRTGTGGTAGVDYLDATALKYRVFPDLWTVRTLLVRRGALPGVEDPAYYDLRFRG